MSVYDKLKELGITLPPVPRRPPPTCPSCAPATWCSSPATSPRRTARPGSASWARPWTEEGKPAARAIAVDLMGTLHAAVGDLNKVKRIVKVMSLVNSTPEFTEQHLVTNGASELFGQVFGDKGAHARSAFGVAQIPMGACVEIELIAEIG
jgi:hypothetical protein